MGIRRRWPRGLLVAAATGVLAGAAGVAGAAVTAAGDGAGGGAVAWTDSGPVKGTVEQGYRVFLGIPFAAAPVGELRWRSPQPPQRWSQPRDATKPASRCAQGPGGGTPSTSEDCLYLNVATPRSAGHGRLKPVMLWVHGAGNSFGAGGDYGAERLAAGADAVVVTPNFRLGVFGFFGHQGLAGSGGFGLEDQQAALRWVQRNAAAFGGDPGNVTLFGESNGAFDVCAQLTSPATRGLFHRAIMQSGTCGTTWPANGIVNGQPAATPWLPLGQVQANGQALAARHGCPDPATAVECLRRVPAAELTADQQLPVLTPAAFGNRVLPERPDRALAAGRFHRVPVISGHTRDEGRLAAAFAPQPFDEEQYQRLLTGAFGDQARLVAARYPSSAFGSPAQAWGAILTDRVWACRQLADDRRLASRTPVYGYEFADRHAPTGFFPFPPNLPPGAFHSSELAYLFNVAGFAVEFTPEQQRLSSQMIRYWGRFAATGNPNGPDLPAWSRFRTANSQSLAPGDGGIHPVNVDSEHDCGFWAAHS
jgi:para-nitrobenzyl esterase